MSQKLLVSYLMFFFLFSLLSNDIVEDNRQLWTFGKSENWTIWWPKEKGEQVWKVEKTNDDTMLTLNSSKNEMTFNFFEGHLKGVVKMCNLVSFTVNLELLSGNGIEVGLILQDEQSELLVYKPVILKSGYNSITWFLDKDLIISYPFNNSPVNKKPDGNLNIWEFSIKKLANSPEVKIKFIDAYCTERRPLLDFLNVELSTGHPINLVVLPEAKEKANIIIKNSSNFSIPFKLDLKVKTYNEKEWNESIMATVKAKSEYTREIPEKSGDCGIRWVTWKLSKGNYSVEGNSSWARMKPSGPTKGLAPNFLFSVCTHADNWPREIREKEFQALGLCGCKVVRCSPGWAQIESEEGKYNWNMMDELVQLAHQYNMEIQGNPGNCTKWAAREDKALNPNHLIWLFSPPVRAWDKWGKFNYVIANRYKGKIRYWEIGNENDLEFFWNGTTDEYIKYLNIAYTNIKKANPDAYVMTCGFSGIGPHDGKKLNPDMQEKVIREAQNSFDIHAFHQHGLFDYFQKIVDEELPKLRSVLKSSKPLYFNETAMYSCSIGEKGQAETLYKKLLLSFARGAIGYTWYDLRNDGTDPHEPEHNFGMLTYDFHPKAVYIAYNTLTGLLLDKKFVKQYDLGTDAYVFEFKGNSEYIISAWLEKKTLSDKLMAFQIEDNASAKIVDLMGNEIDMPVNQNIILFPVNTECKFLKISKNEKLIYLGSIVNSSNITPVEPEKDFKIRCSIINPCKTVQNLRMKLNLPNYLKAQGTLEYNFPLKTQEKKEMYFLVLSEWAPDILYSEPIITRLEYEFIGTPWRGNLRIPILLKGIIPVDAMTRKEPIFKLYREANIVNFFANDPSNSQYAWKGEKDLSADIWLGLGKENFRLKINVTDDVYEQKYYGENMWMGDSVQWGIKLPDQNRQWEIGFCVKEDGKTDVFCWLKPDGMPDPSPQITVTYQKTKTGIIYDAKVPLIALGITKNALKKDIKFNLIVNDSDFGRREGWIQIAPGIGDTKNPVLWPDISFNYD